MELVLVKLDTGAKLDATECLKGTGAELDSGTDLSSGRSKRMEHSHDRRRESGWRVGGAGE
jgi:hypothetical protein